ncbi:NAD(P)H-hydrate dehydratase [Mucilaginibacter pallidiroseus]|uniref:Bifunctional NAD(P)H-hydrate repair enzyme n=1 Tax=Mucilaginibacter pallidiroseus TaxID=2599295 RepID=A0A563UG38_9SPHI|nr:NAD(P)H-hydrate dehydratase [Mucilaginibacter pallidiroseus]TWR30318.1 NAD(P)H-hydrate dehydratase [Mucilaginibacter pallidiroseus]
MLPLLVSSQIREADAYTIANEPISSIDLMERASKAFVGWFVNHFQDKEQAISVYCGTGNNGGDGLAIARLLCEHSFCNLSVFVARFSEKATANFQTNLERLKAANIQVNELTSGAELPSETAEIIIDALLGSGLNKPLAGDYKKLVEHLNTIDATKVAVDVPTGFYTEGDIPDDATVLKADLVITFQLPKINFLLPESAAFMHKCEVVQIGLSQDFLCQVDTTYYYIEEQDIRQIYKARGRFSHKGTYGHALIIAGKDETMGAALLSSSACAHAGAGLTTACIPQRGLTALNSYQPEVMVVLRESDKLPEVDWDKFTTIGVGPGIGKGDDTLALLKAISEKFNKPIVVDADALNVLAGNNELLAKLPKASVITPHMKEFDRLFGEHKNWWQRLQTAKKKAIELGLHIILKNDFTITAAPNGKLYFNSTGNPAMASGGMGDVLTGIITALLSQTYSPLHACLLGVYLHGKAGDELALPNRMQVVLPGAIIKQLPVTMAKFNS